MDTITDHFTATQTLFIGFITLLCIYKFITRKTYKNLPPGPHPLPIIGTLYSHGLNIAADKLTELSHIYGDVFQIHLGPKRFVVINSYEAIAEAMSRPLDFGHRGVSDKYTWQLTRTRAMHGLVPKNYTEEFVRDRKLCIGILRKLGVGKTVMEDKILQEIETLSAMLNAVADKKEGTSVDESGGLKHEATDKNNNIDMTESMDKNGVAASMAKDKNASIDKDGVTANVSTDTNANIDKIGDTTNAVNPRDVIHSSIANVILHILLNKRFQHGDLKVKAILDHMTNAISYLVYTTIINCMPVLRFFPPFRRILRTYVSGSKGVSEFMKSHAVRMLEDFDPECTDSFVESYFEHMYDSETGKVDVDMESFKYILSDLLTGGVETTATALCWTLVYLANRPDVQEKLHTELTTHTPPNQPVRLTSRDNLPYLQAVMREIHRHATVTNLVLHQSRDSNVTLRGFDIPPNTMLFVNVHGPAKDPNTFGGDAFEFRPERFIDESGAFEKRGHVIPFSVGKRVCPGELLARQMQFLFRANLVKQFRFSAAPVPGGTGWIDEEPVKLATWTPKDFAVKVERR